MIRIDAADDARKRCLTPISKIRTEAVGTMIPLFEDRVIDPDGNLLPLGTPGEYCSRGAGVMLGYWNRPEATAPSQ